MIRLYIDIDGVLLTKRLTKSADGAENFIEYITTNFECYWLTTHCKGNASTAIKYLNQYFDSQTIEFLQKVKPTNWDTLKTEALDLNSDFYWLDDYPLNIEIEWMKKKGIYKRLIIVDLNNDNELENIKKQLHAKKDCAT